MTYGILCENCGFHWMDVDENEYVQKSALEAWDIADAPCPECEKDELFLTEPFCPICQRQGVDACVCDDPEKEREQFEQRERIRRRSEAEKEREAEAIKEILREKLKDVDLEEERRKNREKRKERLQHARKLLKMKAKGDI